MTVLPAPHLLGQFLGLQVKIDDPNTVFITVRLLSIYGLNGWFLINILVIEHTDRDMAQE